MSQNPPNLPADSFLPYAAKPPSNTLALLAMIFGIVSFPLLCVAVGFFTGITAIVLGIVALSSINKNPMQYGGRGMATAGIVTGACAAVLAPLFVALLLPSTGKSRELSSRSLCAANLRGIAQSMVVYASDNADSYPYLGPDPVTAQPALGGGMGNVMNDMFYLVGSGMASPRQFICKSDPAKTAASLSPVSNPAFPGYAPTYWTNPGADPELCYSYSFALQYSSPNALANWWKNTMDAGCPIAADMNPGNQVLPGKTVRNSLNHQGDGQNVVFADAHAEFCRTPLAGEDNDHIYNIGRHQPNTAPGASGLLFPPPPGNTMGSFDTCLQPMILNTTAYTRG